MPGRSTPLSVILVSSGSKGNRLLFRYPYQEESDKEVVQKNRTRNPYALQLPEDDLNDCKPASSIRHGKLVGYSDEILAHILTTETGLCDHRFELTIDDVKFVGQPTLIVGGGRKLRRHDEKTRRESRTMAMFNLVFVLHASADPSVVGCYHDLSKRLVLALKHEERRCGYLSHQAVLMMSAHDEVAAMPEDAEESPFSIMLQKSKLCRDLRHVFNGLCDKGVIHVFINNWIEVSFCLPHKVHNVDQMVVIDPTMIEQSLLAIRPYHALLLLEDEKELQQSLPKDCSPSLRRVIKWSSPLNSLQRLSQDTDLALSQVFQIVGHMVYWGKATIIYPICGSNVYILSPRAPTSANSPYHEEFRDITAGGFLTEALAAFSQPTPFSDVMNIGEKENEAEKVKILVWLLQKRLLIQLHTYVFLMIPTERPTQLVNLQDKHSRPSPSSSSASQDKNSSASTNPSHHGSTGNVADNMSMDSDELSTSLDSYSTLSLDNEGHGHSRQKFMDMLKENLTEAERQCVMNVPAAKKPEDLKLFARLCPYFRGRHHLEEIMYYENVNRSQVYMLLEKFKQVLVVCTHQDAATVAYKEFL
ncbi:GATOR complex protein NPRL3-like [Patiria miniata]|uniref:GATOR complex protein NPRL3 n=1 Tax=Patiria miniata TaxID=46514 RepID=A0A914AZY9_PATMI|nr:GATOR complex protein NPRL3-like [Patiria miniata]